MAAPKRVQAVILVGRKIASVRPQDEMMDGEIRLPAGKDLLSP